MAISDHLTALRHLGLSKNAELSDEQLDIFVGLLVDVPSPLLSAACVRLAKAQTFGFPDVGAIRAMCDQVQVDALPPTKALQASEDDRTKWVHCQDCQDEDGAWRLLWCYGSGEARNTESGQFERVTLKHAVEVCGHPRAHRPHSYAVRCHCHRAQWREDKRRMIAKKYGDDQRAKPRVRA